MRTLAIGALGAGALLLAAGASRGRGGSSGFSKNNDGTLKDPNQVWEALGLEGKMAPKQPDNIPFAFGTSTPAWPIVTKNSRKFVVSYQQQDNKLVGNGARRFLAKRSSGDKFHVGVDLYGNHKDPVLAMEDGVVLNYYHFFHGAYCLIVHHDSGIVVNYGEVEKDSYKKLGFTKGSRVKRGEQIAQVGKMNVSSMLHFEAYSPPQNKNQRYYGDDPKQILNPTAYLLWAKHLAQGEGRAYAMSQECAARMLEGQPVPPQISSIPGMCADLRSEQPKDSVALEMMSGIYAPPSEPSEADGP